jgi:MFS family permease
VGLLLGGVLTEYLSWRWCLFVNVPLALIAVAGAVRLLANQSRDTKVHLDPAGTILVVAGLVGVVYGLSEAETKGWGAPTTIILLVKARQPRPARRCIVTSSRSGFRPAFSPPPRSCAGSCCPPAFWRRPRPRSPRPRHDQEEMSTRDFRSR